MTFIESVIGVILTICIQLVLVSAEYCDNGQYCTVNEYCCGRSCCSSGFNYPHSFWNLWYFWFVMFIIMMSCCGMCSYAKRRQYYGQHNQIIIPTGPGRMTNVPATAYPIGVRPPPPPVVQHQHVLPPQAYQSPPPYSEVTSKPDLYPAYQGPPAAMPMPYPTQQYAYPPQFQQHPMYPPAPPDQGPPQAVPPPYTNIPPTPSAPGDN